MASQSDSASLAPHDPAVSFLDRHHFLLRRLHSLSGIVPVGVFVIMHLFANFQMIMGTDSHGQSHFQHEVDLIHAFPALLFVEVSLWLGIGFHAALGLVYTFSGKPNTRSYPYADNWRYSLQRITGIIALVFIFLHIATLRWRWSIFGWFTPFYVYSEDGATPLAHATTTMALQSNVVLIFYIVGVLSVVYHWANGLWTAAISWGLTISEAAQRRWGYACTALGVALTLFTAGAIIGARSYEISPQEQAAYDQMVNRSQAASESKSKPVNPASRHANITTDPSQPDPH